jgi:Cft2 family RNA processing exonuclease
MTWLIQAAHGIHLPQIGWHLDGVRGLERSFVSHAHSDHIARHELSLCTAPTARLMQARLRGRKRGVIELPFCTEHRLGDGTRVVLHPAGHILGSAQFWAENEHGRLLYTGDFKLRRGGAAEPCATPRADVLIMETTFGLPRYVFPPPEVVRAQIIDFCLRALADGVVPVLHAYSLGKTQELLSLLRGSGLAVMLEREARRLTHIYEEFGVAFDPHEELDPARAAGHVVICPPYGVRSVSLRDLPRRRTAVVTGWAVDRSTQYRARCDAAFPLSDHAGFDDLLLFVEAVQPKVVLTVHGFAEEFAATLRARGIEAWALGRENQLDLPLTLAEPVHATGTDDD